MASPPTTITSSPNLTAITSFVKDRLGIIRSTSEHNPYIDTPEYSERLDEFLRKTLIYTPHEADTVVAVVPLTVLDLKTLEGRDPPTSFVGRAQGYLQREYESITETGSKFELGVLKDLWTLPPRNTLGDMVPGEKCERGSDLPWGWDDILII
jgi:hypothetical protein